MAIMEKLAQLHTISCLHHNAKRKNAKSTLQSKHIELDTRAVKQQKNLKCNKKW
jgi:hypothetical protein